MALITMREALRQAIHEEMTRDSRVFLMGEEVAEYNGAYKVSQGLLDAFGSSRVIDTPISEAAFTGIGIGAAMVDLRPIVEWMTMNFAILALDQIINNAAKMRYMSGGQFSIPAVFRGPNGPAEYLGAQHSQALQSIFTHIPGLKVVVPSTPADAKGLLKSSIRDNNPVIFLESELLYGLKGEVPSGEHLVTLGTANIIQSGTDVTLISYGKPVHLVLAAVLQLAQENISAEVIDLRTLRPLDEKTVFNSVKKTNRCVIIDESLPFASVGSHIGWLVSHFCFDYLDAPVELISMEDVPMPYNHTLELAAQPSLEKIVRAVKNVMYRR